MDETEALKKALARARLATQEAENLLESKSAELYEANQQLISWRDTLQEMVSERTLALANKVSELEALRDSLRTDRDEAREASHSKTAMFARLSHEVRTPLNAIIGTLNIIDHDLKDSPPREMLKTAIANCEQLRLMLDDSIDISRLEEGVIEIEVTSFAVDAFLFELKSFWDAEAGQNSALINVHTNNLPENLVIEADRVRMYQIMNNLLANAIKYVGGVINLSASLIERNNEQPFLKLDVIDRGDPVSKNVREELFGTPIDASSSIALKNVQGSGLGLAISRDLAALMRGTLSLEPGPANRGNCFSLLVPVTLSSDGNGTLQRNHDNKKIVIDELIAQIKVQTAEKRFQALIAEDVPTNQLVLKRYLEMVGIASDTASNGLVAVERIQTRKYDIIFMDIAMPVMDGTEATRQIHKILGKDAPPIVAVSAHTFKQDHSEMESAGIIDFVDKPINREKLYRVIQDHLLDAATQRTSVTAEQHLAMLPPGINDYPQEIIDQYIEDVARIKIEALQARDASDPKAIIAAVHKLKGLLGAFGHPASDEIAEWHDALKASNAHAKPCWELVESL